MISADVDVLLPDDFLTKVDRASMASSLEVRVPFLDHRILEWAWRQPMAVKASGGVGKLVVRRLAESVLPAEVTNRPKMGFAVPLSKWFRGPLKQRVRDRVAPERDLGNGGRWLAGDHRAVDGMEDFQARRRRGERTLGVRELRDVAGHHEAGMPPAKVDRTALQNAASVAGLLLTTDCIVTEAPKDEDDNHAGHGARVRRRDSSNAVTASAKRPAARSVSPRWSKGHALSGASSSDRLNAARA